MVATLCGWCTVVRVESAELTSHHSDFRYIQELHGTWKKDPRFKDTYYFLMEEEEKK